MKHFRTFAALIAGLWCSIAANAHDFEVEGIYYNITSSTNLTVEVTYQGYSSDAHSNEYRKIVTIPATVTYNDVKYNVTSIGTRAFYACDSLTAVTFSENSKLTSIGGGAFRNCTKLTSITIPEGVTSIDDDAFGGCSGLTTITIPESMKTIGIMAFHECTALSAVHICSIESWCEIDFRDGVGSAGSLTSNPLSYAHNLYLNNELVTEVVIPSTVTSIRGAFHSSNITSVYIPDCVTSISDYAFFNCNNLASVDIPQSVTSIGNEAFANCIELATINIPESVFGIGRSAFAYCSKLTTINIPENSKLNGIDEYAFGNCSNLTAITIPEGVTSIGDYAFAYCSSLTTITIPESVTSIGSSAFSGCSKLERVELNCSNIKEGWFNNNTNIKEIALGENVTSIGERAFQECTSLHRVDCYAKEVPALSYTAFYNIEKITLYVPREVTRAYRSAQVWSNFGSIFSMGTITSTNQLSSDKVYWISLPYRNATSWAVAEGGDAMKANAELNIQANPDDPRQQFAFVSNDDGATRYLYHVAGKRFVNKDGALNIGAEDPIYFKDGAYEGTFMAYFDYAHYVNINSVPSMIIDYWDTADGGNSCEIIPVGDFDPQEALTRLPIEKDGIVYVKIGEGELMVKSASQVSGDLTIPAITTEGGRDYTVTSIGNNAFQNCSGLTSIAIPEGVTSIGDWAFSGCIKLASITIPESVNSIGEYAFFNCSSLTSITIPESVTSIGDGAFSYCSSLAAINIPESVTSIGNFAFRDCSNLTSITIPEGVNSIGDWAFSGCIKLERAELNCSNIGTWFSNIGSLKEVVLGDNVTTIENEAFSGCSKLERVELNCSNIGTWFSNIGSLKEVVLGDNVTTIENEAFIGCSSLAAINIPEGVTSIGDWAFVLCSSLTSIAIPEGVTKIGDGAFFDCSGLTSITIPESVTSIGESAFFDCSSLAAINIPEGVTSIGYDAFAGCNSLTSITIPEGVNSIGESAFNGCSSLEYIELNCPTVDKWFSEITSIKEVVLGESVTEIKYGAFKNCSSLIKINIPEGVTSIGDDAFLGCSSLEDITLNCPIVDNWFSDITSIKEVVLGESVTSIGANAFYGCENLTAVHASDVESWCNIDFGNSSANPLCYAQELYFNGELVTDLTIPNTITAIKDYAFYGCGSLTSVSIPESVTSIGTSAFEYCNNLISVHAPSIEYWCGIDFGNSYANPLCYAQNLYLNGDIVTDLVIPNTVNAIKDYTFYSYESLTSISIHESVTSIGANAFYGCESLTAVHASSVESWCNIDFGNSSANPLCYAQELYFNGSLVTDLIIPNSVTAIKDYAFYSYDSLTSVSIPESVTSIGAYAFYDCCNSLTSILVANSNTNYDSRENCNAIIETNTNTLILGCPFTIIPESVTSIGANAFYGCSRLTTITIPENITSVASNAFTGCNSLEQATINCSNIGSWFGRTGSSLTKLILGEKVEKISGIFTKCKEVICYATTPPSCSARTFATSATVYVPAASLEDYLSHSTWRRFNIVGMETGIENVDNSEIINNNSEVIYDLMGRRVAAPQKGGVYIVNGKKVVIK